jgi:hypothetical protein
MQKLLNLIKFKQNDLQYVIRIAQTHDMTASGVGRSVVSGDGIGGIFVVGAVIIAFFFVVA